MVTTPGGVGVSLQGLGKRFAERRTLAELARAPFRRRWHQALAEVTLDVAPGEFVGLLGPNGAGKSTLFRILSTLLVPDAGDALVGGASVRTAPGAVRRLMSPVSPDERSLWWRLSALENLRIFGVLHGLPGRAAEARAAELLALVRLEDTGTRLVGAFSSGMRQRLLVARALMGTPRLLLLDEPTRSLDPISARDLRRFLREELNGRLGCTVLLATHSHEEALECCDRIGVLHHGRLLAAGPRAALVRELSDDQYRLAATAEAGPRLAALAAAGRLAGVEPLEQAGGWPTWRVRIPGGEAAAAEVLGALVAAGVAVSGFTREEPTLADLLERIVARTATPEPAHA